MGIAIFSQLGIHIPITPFLLFAVFAVLLFLWALFTWIVRYHWKSYGTNKLDVMSMSFIYFIGSAVLLAGMALFAFLYNFSAI